MSIILTEKRLREIIRKCINEQRGVYYDKKLVDTIIGELFYMVLDDNDAISFEYDGYDYCITTKPLLMNDFYDDNSDALGGCREFMGRIEISINPRTLRKFENTIKSCGGNLENFMQTEGYKQLEDKFAYILTHELTHAQEKKSIIDNKKKNGDGIFDSPFELDNSENDNKFNNNESSKLEKNIVYWFSSRERQARLSQGYVIVKRQISTALNTFGKDFINNIGNNEIYNELYKATETNHLDKLYNDLLSTTTENLQNILTKQSEIFRPRTNKLRYEYKRLIGVLQNIIEYNKKKLIKVTGMIIDELKK